MLLSCPLWCHDISFSPLVDIVLLLALTSPPLSVHHTYTHRSRSCAHAAGFTNDFSPLQRTCLDEWKQEQEQPRPHVQRLCHKALREGQSAHCDHSKAVHCEQGGGTAAPYVFGARPKCPPQTTMMMMSFIFPYRLRPSQQCPHTTPLRTPSRSLPSSVVSDSHFP